MAKNEAKIKFTAETGEFNNQIKSANDEMSLLRAELKLNETQMKATGTTAEGLKNKHNILSKELDAAKNKTEALNQKVKKAVEIFGENSTEATKLKTQLANAKNAEEKIKQEVNLCNKELDEQKNSSDKLEKSLDEVEDSAKKAGDGFTVMKGAMSNLIADGVTGLVNGVTGAISGIAGLEEETREYRAEMAKLDASFSETSFYAEDAKRTYKDLYAVLGDEGQAVEAASFIGQLCKSEEELANWSTICTGVYGKFGASLPVEGLAEAANETAKVGQVTGPLADALNWTTMRTEGWNAVLGNNQKALAAFNEATENGANQEEAFNAALAECSTEQERSSLITATLTGMYEGAAISFEETNAAVMDANRAQSDYTDTMAAFGEKVAPVTTTVKEGFNGLLQEVYALVEDVDIGGFTSAIESGFSTVKDTVLPAVVEGFKNLKEAWQWLGEHTGLLATVATAIGVVTAGITAYNVVQAISTAMKAAEVTTVWALVSAQLAHAAAAIAAVAPYVLVAAAIAAVITVIVLCVKHWDTIKAKITEVAQKVKEKVLEIKNNVSQKLNEAKQKAVEIFNNMRTAVTEKIMLLYSKVTSVFSTLKNKITTMISTARTNVVTFFNNMRTGVTEKVMLLYSKVTSVFSTLKNKISTMISTARNNVVTFFDNIRTGVATKVLALYSNVTSIFSTLKNKITTMISTARTNVVSIIEKLRSGFSSKISSLKNSVSTTFSNIKNAIITPIDTAKNTVSGIVDKIKGFFSNLKLSLPKIKLPHFSITGSFSLNPPSVPKLSIDWYKDGGIMTRPTIFGFNGSSLMAGGEAGAEAILPIDKLKDYIADTVEDKMNVVNLGALADAIERLADRPIDFNINGRKFAEATAGDSDRVNGLRSSFLNRGLALD